VHYGWDEEKLLSDFFERGVDFVYKSAGVVAPKEAEEGEEDGGEEAEKEEEKEEDGEDHEPKAKYSKKEVACER
jgi:hypothetical protein